jgi:hypothetical protein
MILGAEFSTLLVVVLFAAVLVYRVSFIRNKSIGYFSILQIIYLVVIPGFLFPMAYSYLQSILTRPLNQKIVLPDGLLVNVILLSLLFTYGGVAVHATTKMMAELLRGAKSGIVQDIQRMNKFFHLTFSHNLAYSGIVLAASGLVLLELNHIPGDPQSFFEVIWKGIVLGFCLIAALFFYTRSADDYVGRWADLKIAFLVFWVGFVAVLYGVRKVNPRLNNYQLLIPALLSLSLVGVLNVVLVVRRLKRGGWRVSIRWKQLIRLLIRDNAK